jgi:hypothetical protein
VRNFKSTVQRLREMLANEPVEQQACNDEPLIHAMAKVLGGMTASQWPDRVFALGDAESEVPDTADMLVTTG